MTERASLPSRYRGNVLLEQEKQRTIALQREELASFHKLQSQHRQEQQRWEKERERHRQQVEATEARLRQREEECKRLEVNCPSISDFIYEPALYLPKFLIRNRSVWQRNEKNWKGNGRSTSKT